ncbi:hypothetical protein GW17_00031762 [Ensete ventricosum]|nr:hypothetical protein GW17_00031762 [Ensete ventricosum]
MIQAQNSSSPESESESRSILTGPERVWMIRARRDPMRWRSGGADTTAAVGWVKRRAWEEERKMERPMRAGKPGIAPSGYRSEDGFGMFERVPKGCPVSPVLGTEPG